jgi:methionyl aminopeptidase
MVIIRTEKQIDLIGRSGKILAACHRELRNIIRPGITSLEINKFVEEFLRLHRAKPVQKRYKGYPFATCTSINDQACHGFPANTHLKEGDIVGIDIVVNLNGWLADSAWTYAVGQISEQAQILLRVAKECLYRGIEKASIGNRIGDISYAIASHAKSHNLSVVREFTGHGIGRSMHEDLQVPHFGRPNKGTRLSEGMVFTIEPIVNIGSNRVKIDRNKWTVRTADGSLSAQYEHTIAITKGGPLILTEQDE